MAFEIIILALLVGVIKGGNIGKLEKLHIKGWYLLATSFTIEIASLFLISKTNYNISRILEDKFSIIHILVYSLLIIGLFMNRREKGFKIIMLGSILNFLTILANYGKMPVSIKSLENAGLYNQLTLLYDDRIMTHVLMTENTKLSFLGDIIPIARPYPFPKIISFGDILISIGLFILIYSYMIKKEKHINIFKI